MAIPRYTATLRISWTTVATGPLASAGSMHARLNPIGNRLATNVAIMAVKASVIASVKATDLVPPQVSRQAPADSPTRPPMRRPSTRG